jgi:Glycosyl hydrolases family 2, sugar binding domain
MYPHRIRLRGPWEYQPLARRVLQADGSVEFTTDNLPPASRINMPARWREAGLDDFAGRVRFLRRFGLPRQLDDYERVWLTFAGVTGSAQVSLNGSAVGSQPRDEEPFEFEITSLLEERNRLVVEVESATPDGGLWGEVALEIRCAAFLRAVEIAARARAGEVELQARGEVAGKCDLPLELYVLLGRSTVAYARVEAGRPFLLVSERLSEDRWRQAAEVRVELVQGASVWHHIDQAISHSS